MREFKNLNLQSFNESSTCTPTHSLAFGYNYTLQLGGQKLQSRSNSNYQDPAL